MRTSLYRHYDSNGILLYIGVSLSQLRRLQEHSRNSSWFDTVATIKVEYFETRNLALQAEQAAIILEKPLHNKAHSLFPSEVSELIGEFLNLLVGCSSLGTQTVILNLLKISSTTGEVNVSYSELAEHTKLSVRSIASSMQELTEKAYITRLGKQSYKISPKLAWFGNQVDWAIALQEERLDD
jgi:predicted GIY-YIG superfamily endonuclease